MSCSPRNGNKGMKRWKRLKTSWRWNWLWKERAEHKKSKREGKYLNF